MDGETVESLLRPHRTLCKIAVPNTRSLAIIDILDRAFLNTTTLSRVGKATSFGAGLWRKVSPQK